MAIPWRVRAHARIVYWLWRPAWRGVWVRYWESQGISEEQQMEWAAEADEGERLPDRNAESS
jgi:hypothetical protein